MYTVWVRLEIHPGKTDEFLAGIRANARASLRDEPGCLRFDVHRSTDEPHTFHLYEIYADRDAFERDHRNAPHYQRWQKIVAACVVPGTQANTYAEPVFPSDVPEHSGADS